MHEVNLDPCPGRGELGSTGVSGESAERPYLQAVTSIYGEQYAAEYAQLYITPWRHKHELNRLNLNRILAALGPNPPVWLDLACGPAWHFAQFPQGPRRVGLDLSHAQLLQAKRNAPGADFVRADMGCAPLRAASFDLVTNFWAAYCYLGSSERIEGLLRQVVEWIRPGGALYLEVLLPRDLESFNRSHFAQDTGFSVVPLLADYTAWGYSDRGGHHVMQSPPLELFTHVLSPHFGSLEATHDGAFMVHLIATARK